MLRQNNSLQLDAHAPIYLSHRYLFLKYELFPTNELDIGEAEAIWQEAVVESKGGQLPPEVGCKLFSTDELDIGEAEDIGQEDVVESEGVQLPPEAGCVPTAV